MGQWLIIIVWLLSAIALVALLSRRKDWRWQVPRHRIDGFRCELGTAQIVEDNIVRQVWAIPIILTNDRHRLGRIASVDAIAHIRSTQRTSVLHRPFRYHGTFMWDEAAGASRSEVNPGATVTATVRVELPVDEIPEALTFTTSRTRRRRRRAVRYGARVPLPEAASTEDMANV
ncbi:hypothetical protein ACIPY5_19790 [Microbacterium sp. NPDC089698]|uniref:hypothetical protein n=1 Tax=Microbacterium sp. NPDC089698 TaxID=3364200 RepID=UPI0037FF34DF